ncbi:AAA family ATPase [Sorangium sp. So ce341]|uniref:AAA family ATPase n=1 Tax=Sorangium sp. So ce341 TaxID=3133302 RepID=UPI003F61BB9E
MSYRALFDPKAHEGRSRPGAVRYLYEHDPGLVLAINVALASRRPLLLRGDPGSGKSSLAADVAFCMDRRYEEEVVTSRTQAQDLQWRFDAVRRLADAQARAARGIEPAPDDLYVEPGVLWRAFAPGDARRYGSRGRSAEGAPQSTPERGAVVLLDEIDKADPDVPNDLLVAIDARWFRVPEIDHEVRAAKDLELLLVITTNGERELPAAFLRRCIVYELATPAYEPSRPDESPLKRIAQHHVPTVKPALIDLILKEHHRLFETATGARLRPPSTAELLDAVRACEELGITDVDDDRWTAIANAAMWKHAPRRKGGS